jgi:WD40 repeat protein
MTLRLWDAVSGAHLATLSGHYDQVTSVIFSADGSLSGSHDKTPRLWDAVSRAHLAALSGHSDLVTSVAFSPDGTRVVSGSDDDTLRVGDTASGRHLQTAQGHAVCTSFLTRTLNSSRASFSQTNPIRSLSIRSVSSYRMGGWTDPLSQSEPADLLDTSLV